MKRRDFFALAALLGADLLTPPRAAQAANALIKVGSRTAGTTGGGMLTGKKAPHGVYHLLPTDQIISSGQSCWTNPAVDGVRLRVSAAHVRPTATTYNWDSMDAASALAATNGRQWSCGVSWSIGTPSWVGANFIDLPSTGSTPLPWDPLVVAAELDTIDAFAARFDTDPNLTYVVVGGLRTGGGFESYVANSQDDVDYINDPDMVAKWIAVAEQLASRLASKFTHTPVLIAGANPFPNDKTSLLTVANAQAAAYANAGNMCCSLKKASSAAYEPNGLINTYATTHPCAFQFVSAIGDQSRTGGTLAECCDVGIALLHGRGAIEVYAPDCDNSANLSVLNNVSAQLVAATW